MNLRYGLTFVNGAVLLFAILCSCGKSSHEDQSTDHPSIEIEIDSASYKFAKNSIDEEVERVKVNRNIRMTSFDSTKRMPLFTYEYFLDNEQFSVEDFFTEVDSNNIEHFTRTMDRRVVENSEDDEDTLVFSENGDRIHSQYEFVTKLSAYTRDYIASRIFEIDHIDLHYSPHNVLYLSLGSSITGKMNAQVYNNQTGEKITSYQRDGFDGSFYLGNGIINKFNYSDVDNLNDTEKIRVVVMIDDQFCFTEFETKDIIEQEQVTTL